jgi:hypothetical protein
MSIQPEGEDLRKAVKWISEKIKDCSDKPVMKLIEEAAMKFDLAPKDQEYLIRFYCKKES